MKATILATIFLLLFSTQVLAQGNLLDSLKLQSEHPKEDSLLQLLEMNPADEVRFQTLLKLSVFARSYSIETSKQYLKLAQILAIEQNNKIWLARVKRNQGIVEEELGNYKKSQQFSEEAFRLFEASGDKKQIINMIGCLVDISIVQKNEGQLTEALKTLELAITYFENNDIQDRFKSLIFINLSNVYDAMSLHSKGLEALFEAMKYAKNANDTQSLAKISCNLGIAYYDQKQYDTAIPYFEKSLTIQKKSNDTYGQMINLSYLSGLHQEKKQYDKAAFFIEEMLALANNSDIKSYTWDAKIELAALYLGNKKYDKALDVFKSLNPDDIKGDVYYLFNFHNNLSLIYLGKKNYNKAIFHAEEARENAQKMGRLSSESLALNTLHQVYFADNQMAKAYQYLLKYQATQDSLVNESNIAALTTQKLQFDFEKEQEVFQLEKVALESEVHTQSVTRWALLGLLLSVGIIAFLGYKYYRKENDLLLKDLENKQTIEAQAEKLRATNQQLEQAIEEREELNQQLQTKNEVLTKLDETKTRFFSNVSHEFKTPLTLILNPISRLLTNSRLNDEDKFLAQLAEQNSLQLLSLTNQVLELTKFEVDKVTSQPSAFNLVATAKKLYADFESLAFSQQIKFNQSIEANQELNLFFDYTKFTTIFRNLISNAIKFTPEHGTVLFNVIEKEQEVEIQIKDTGRGIHATDLPNIFKRYYQAKITSHIQEGGTGIGLAICAEYTKLLGGEIRVQSAYGVGSIFIVTFPKKIASKKLQPNMVTEPAAKEVTNVFSENIPNKTRPTILLVEDNLEMQNYLRIVLQPHYQLEIAPHGKAALAVLEQKYKDIQLIISDVMMPEMDGYELLGRLKQHANYTNIPTVMLTALSGTNDKLKALRVGIDDYLTKPFSDEELQARVKNLIEYRTARITYLEDTIPRQDIEKIKHNQKDLEWLEQLEHYITQNLSSSLSTEIIAYKMSISQKTLYNKTKILTGLTPTKYVNEIRYQTARRLIEEHRNWTVKAIALKVGFRDEKNFSRNFKKRFGRNPSAYLE